MINGIYGRVFKVKIDSFIASRSNIGIAVKDNSILDANNVEMKIVKYCLSTYNKRNDLTVVDKYWISQ